VNHPDPIGRLEAAVGDPPGHGECDGLAVGRVDAKAARSTFTASPDR
jgi:hypothetical protein